jgi:acetylornithine deacetylase/succinyl-diaminopimelate desuccinylase-like protein
MKFLAHVLAIIVAPAIAQTPEQRELRDIYKELVEINTTDSVGSCTQAAEALKARLKAGGIAESDLQVLVPPGGPKKGNLVARYRGTGAKKPLMLLGHLDVVEAKREDWERDPFKLVEENGYFYGRGASDDKSMVAVFVANLIRYQARGLPPRARPDPCRDLRRRAHPLQVQRYRVPAEESPQPDRRRVCPERRRERIARRQGRATCAWASRQARRCSRPTSSRSTNPGGHSSLPVKENAIYRLAGGLARLGAFDFPFKLTDTTRLYFERMSKIEKGPMAADMAAILRNPPDPQAIARLSSSTAFNNATVRTTCVATMVDAGHATNALPQRARAIVNCRILPGEPVDEVTRTLVRVLADDKIKLTPTHQAVLSPPPPLTREILGPGREGQR